MRDLACIVLTRQQALLLREAIRPLTPLPFAAGTLIDFCESLYRLILDMETHNKAEGSLLLNRDYVMIINQFVGAEDFDGAAMILEQTRAALHEIVTGARAVYFARSEDIERLMVEFPALTDNAEGGDVKAPTAQEKTE